jgi:hypothetical protein
MVIDDQPGTDAAQFDMVGEERQSRTVLVVVVKLSCSDI